MLIYISSHKTLHENKKLRSLIFQTYERKSRFWINWIHFVLFRRFNFVGLTNMYACQLQCIFNRWFIKFKLHLTHDLIKTSLQIGKKSL